MLPNGAKALASQASFEVSTGWNNSIFLVPSIPDTWAIMMCTDHPRKWLATAELRPFSKRHRYVPRRLPLAVTFFLWGALAPRELLQSTACPWLPLRSPLVGVTIKSK
jgi:hypothetical protein